MAYSYSLNQSLSTFAENLFSSIACLLAAGWTKIQDSDGTTYSSSGTQVTGGGTGANGLNNSRAWVCLKAPSPGTGSICIQNSTSGDASWRVTFSPVAGFTSGSPGAIQVPSASDEILCLGFGTDASPSFQLWFTGTEGSTRWNTVANSAAPFDFWFQGWPVGGGTPIGGAFYDGIVNGFPSVDDDPHVLNVDTSGWSSSSLSGSSRNFGLEPYLNTGGGFSGIPFPWTTPTSGLAVDPVTGKDQLRALEYYTGSGYYKGQSSNVFWEMTGTSGNPRNLAQLLSVNATGDYIVIGQLAVPWQSGTVPTV